MVQILAELLALGLDLETVIYSRDTLVNGRSRQDVDIWLVQAPQRDCQRSESGGSLHPFSLTITQPLLHVLLRESTRHLDQAPLRATPTLGFPSAVLLPVLLDGLGRRHELIRGKVVEHDDVGSGFDRFTRFLQGLALDVNSEGEPGDGSSGQDGFSD